MKKRRQFWIGRIEEMFIAEPKSKDIEKRYNSLRYLLLQQYPQIKEIPKETFLELLRDCLYVDRMLRRMTEGEQTEQKKLLSEDYQVNELNYGNGY